MRNGASAGSSQDGRLLEGLRILDFTHVLSGPYCTMLLGDLGADVLKVEPPDGDSLRKQGPPFHNGQGMSFLACNRNKRSLVLDLSTAAGKEKARSLAMRADVLVENFRPGVMDRLGLGWERLNQAHPKLVYCSLSGFGSTGPYAQKGAFDLTVQAMGGYMSITGERQGGQVKLGTSAFDLVAGMNAAIAVQAALLRRARTGQGGRVETSLFESELAFLTNVGVHYLTTGENPQKWGSEHPESVPYKAFRAVDGWIVIAAGLQQIYVRLAAALERPELASDARFASPAARATNRIALYAELDALIAGRQVDDLLETLEAAGVPASPVNSVGQALEDPQAQHREMVKKLTHPLYGDVRLLGSAIKTPGADVAREWRPPPLLGEGGDDAMQEWLAD
jgi:crotonobetainyl-CoA:carnitine CoA-transferase CaiB-like acyl-CoA transferase